MWMVLTAVWLVLYRVSEQQQNIPPITILSSTYEYFPVPNNPNQYRSNPNNNNNNNNNKGSV